MSKFIEELNNGDIFSVDSFIYVITCDFKKNGSRLAISLKDGSCKWFDPSYIVEDTQLYIMDKDNNILSIKPTEKTDVNLDIKV